MPDVASAMKISNGMHSITSLQCVVDSALDCLVRVQMQDGLMTVAGLSRYYSVHDIYVSTDILHTKNRVPGNPDTDCLWNFQRAVATAASRSPHPPRCRVLNCSVSLHVSRYAGAALAGRGHSTHQEYARIRIRRVLTSVCPLSLHACPLSLHDFSAGEKQPGSFRTDPIESAVWRSGTLAGRSTRSLR